MEGRPFCLVHEILLSLHRNKQAEGGQQTQKSISEAAHLLDT